MNAVAGRRPETYGLEPFRFDQMRPGCYDVDARVRDMDINGVWASVNFPSMITGFCGRVFFDAKDRDLGLACVRAWNDWLFEEWYTPHPERIVPLGITYLADPDARRGRDPPQRRARLHVGHLPRAPARDRAALAVGPGALGPHHGGRGRDRHRRLAARRQLGPDPGAARGRHRRPAARGHALRAAVAHRLRRVAVVGLRAAPPDAQDRHERGRHRLGGHAARPPRQHRRPLRLRPGLGGAARRGAAAQLLVLHDRRPLDHRHPPRHRGRPHHGRGRLPARRQHLARHPGRDREVLGPHPRRRAARHVLRERGRPLPAPAARHGPAAGAERSTRVHADRREADAGPHAARGARRPGPRPVAGGLQRPPGRPHHGQPGRRHAAVQPVAAHLGRAAAVAGAAHRPRRPRRRGGLARPARHPAPPRAAQAAGRRRLGGAQPPALRHGVGRPGRGAADPRPELGARRRHRSCWSTSTRGRSTTPRARAGPWSRWATPRWRCSPATASSSSGARPAPCTSVRWRSSSAASTPGTPAPPGARTRPRVPQAFIDLMARSDGEGFLGFWEAAVRAELAADPDLLD